MDGDSFDPNHQECADACHKDGDCVAWTYEYDRKRCWFKPYVPNLPWAYKKTVVSGVQ